MQTRSHLHELADLIQASVAADQPLPDDVAEALATALSEPGVERLVTVRVLIGNSSVPVRAALARCLGEDPDPAVRRLCVLAARFDSGFDAAALRAAANDADAVVRAEALAVLADRATAARRKRAPRALLEHLKQSGAKLATDLGLAELRGFLAAPAALLDEALAFFHWLHARPAATADLGSADWFPTRAPIAGEGCATVGPKKLPEQGRAAVRLRGFRVDAGVLVGDLDVVRGETRTELARGLAALEFTYTEVRENAALRRGERRRLLAVVDLDECFDEKKKHFRVRARIAPEGVPNPPTFDVPEDTLDVRLFLSEWMAEA